MRICAMGLACNAAMLLESRVAEEPRSRQEQYTPIQAWRLLLNSPTDGCTKACAACVQGMSAHVISMLAWGQSLVSTEKSSERAPGVAATCPRTCTCGGALERLRECTDSPGEHRC